MKLLRRGTCGFRKKFHAVVGKEDWQKSRLKDIISVKDLECILT
jgi:hypothetical protein